MSTARGDYPLFQDVAHDRRPIRPLGETSDFVVEQLPQELATIRDGLGGVGGLIERCEQFLGNISIGSFDEEPDFDLALLDLIFLESGIVHSGGVPGERLTRLVDQFSLKVGRIPALTYEDVILINPLESDPRTFTQGEIGLTERNFYWGHQQIEQCLTRCISFCEEAIQHRGTSADHLEKAMVNFQPVIAWMEEIGMNMPREHFAVFRRYFTAHPTRGFKGPSGVFSAGIPTLEVLLAGVELPLGYFQYYMEENSAYLPREGRKSLEVACRRASKGESIADIIKVTADQELRDAAQSLGDAMRRFRGMHYKGVAHQIPEVLAGQGSGTGGETAVREFLLDRMRIRHINEGG